MITKEQALTEQEFIQTHEYCDGIPKLTSNGRIVVNYTNIKPCKKPYKWRANGKCQTWKTRPDEFRLPIKHGLYDYGYITHENAHLFEVAK